MELDQDLAFGWDPPLRATGALTGTGHQRSPACRTGSATGVVYRTRAHSPPARSSALSEAYCAAFHARSTEAQPLHLVVDEQVLQSDEVFEVDAASADGCFEE